MLVKEHPLPTAGHACGEKNPGAIDVRSPPRAGNPEESAISRRSRLTCCRLLGAYPIDQAHPRLRSCDDPMLEAVRVAFRPSAFTS